MKTIAYSYLRFSTPEQEQGHSEQRQIELSRAYAEKHGLLLDDSLKPDRGISGYRGKNVTEGNLGEFLKKIENGDVAPGSILLVESLDRLSRGKIYDALSLFKKILDHQITIVTLADEREYSAEKMDDIDLIISILMMSRAHEESEIKGMRVRAAWKKKRGEVRTKKLTRWSPKWVYLTEDREKFRLIEDRANVIRKIFNWAAAGMGTTLIIKKLEAQGIEPWDMGEKQTSGSRRGKKWHGSYIQRLLHNRAVLGEYTIRQPDDKEGYITVKDYFPRVIEDQLFYKAKRERESRNVRKGGLGAGRKGKHLSNLFSGIAYCGYSVETSGHAFRCDGNEEKMVFVNKGKKYRYLQCSRLKNGNSGCASCSKMWRYDAFEKSFFSFIDDIDVSEISGYHTSLSLEIQELKTSVATLKGKFADVQNQISKYEKAMDEAEDIPQMMIDKVSILEAEAADLKNLLEESSTELDAKEREYEEGEKTNDSLRNIRERMESCNGEELFDLRIALANSIRRYIDMIILFPLGYNKPRQDSSYLPVKSFFDSFLEKDGAEQVIAELKATHIGQGNMDTDPFFHVVYKSGKMTVITPDPEDPEELIGLATVDEHGNVDTRSPALDRIIEAG